VIRASKGGGYSGDWGAVVWVLERGQRCGREEVGNGAVIPPVALASPLA